MATPSPDGSSGFYPQPNDWTCGPFALKHALVALGLITDPREIASYARSHWWSGTDEIRLARAARQYGCDLLLERRRDAEQARKLLVKYVRDQTPVLLCVDGWGHWITVVRAHASRFVVIDSQLDPVLNILTWPQLRARWQYLDTDYDATDPPVLYDLLAVQPRFRTAVKADFSVERVKFLRRPENHKLAVHWNEYLEDLLEICRPASSRMLDSLSMGEFLRRHQDLILSRVTYWHGDIERDAILRLLRNFRFVSETYGLVIPMSATRRAVADLAILVTLWTVARRGIDDLYGEGPTAPKNSVAKNSVAKNSVAKSSVAKSVAKSGIAKNGTRPAARASTAKNGVARNATRAATPRNGHTTRASTPRNGTSNGTGHPTRAAAGTARSKSAPAAQSKLIKRSSRAARLRRR